MDTRLDNRGAAVLFPTEARDFSCPKRPDRLWGPLTLLFNVKQALSPRVKLPEGETEHQHHLVSRLRMHGAMSPFPYMPSRPTPGQHKTRQTFTSCYSVDPAIIKSTAFHIILILDTRNSHICTPREKPLSPGDNPIAVNKYYYYYYY
jgi:hypothetical protein